MPVLMVIDQACLKATIWIGYRGCHQFLLIQKLSRQETPNSVKRKKENNEGS